MISKNMDHNRFSSSLKNFFFNRSIEAVNVLEAVHEFLGPMQVIYNTGENNKNGVNSIQFGDIKSCLYSAGRDNIIKVWNVNNREEPFVKSLIGHEDWVNDIVLCNRNRTIISASSDNTVKVWNVKRRLCTATLDSHTDYVRALAYSKHEKRLLSGGFDGSVIMWDIRSCTSSALRKPNTIVSSCTMNRTSVYSLTTNSYGTVVVSGSTKDLQLWDCRTCANPVSILKGHDDTVKALVVSRWGTQCLSGSSDGTVRLWSLRQRKTIAAFRFPGDAIRTIQANKDFAVAYSGGKSGKIVRLDLKNITVTGSVATETHPILKMCLTPDQSYLWVATTASTIKKWSLRRIFLKPEDAIIYRLAD